jgi:hypothetical protein
VVHVAHELQAGEERELPSVFQSRDACQWGVLTQRGVLGTCEEWRSPMGTG